MRSQDPLRTPCVRGTPSPRLSLILWWRLQEAERPRQVSEARMKGIFTAAGTLISFGTEITTPSLIRSQSFSPSAWQAGRWAGGWVLAASALRFSRSAQLIAPWAAPDSCSAMAQHTAGPSRAPSRRSRAARGCCRGGRLRGTGDRSELRL